MAESGYDAAARLSRIAARLHARARAPRRLPALFFVTDPDRIPDPAVVARRLPRGTGVILRHFGRPEGRRQARALAEAAAEGGLVLLIAADPELAAAVGAAGVHLPEARIGEAAAVRTGWPEWLVTAAAHGRAGLRRAARAGADAALLAPVFATASASGRPPLGARRFARLVAKAQLPVYALGGVAPLKAWRLARSNASGLAAVGALAALAQ